MSSTPPPPPPGFGPEQGRPYGAPPPPPGAVSGPYGAPPPPPAYGGYPTAPPPYGYQPARTLAGFGARLGAYLLDGLLYGLLAAVFAVPGIVFIVRAFRDCTNIDNEITCTGDQFDTGSFAIGLALAAIGAIIALVLYIRHLGGSGQTWGRKIVGIRVVRESTGEPIGYGRAIGRALFAGAISGQICYLGYLWMLWDDKNQTWHDKVVDSIVVRV